MTGDMASKHTPPTGFVVPAQPVEQHQPSAGRDWVHEIDWLATSPATGLCAACVQLMTLPTCPHSGTSGRLARTARPTT
jgi:hypothetical protein